MPSSPPRVLVVDDESGMRHSLRDILLDEGCVVDTAEDAARGAALCEGGPFDAALIDVRIPGAGVAEVFRRIRRHRAGARVILMSAFGREDLRQQAVDDGAAELVPGTLDGAMAAGVVARGAGLLVLSGGPDDAVVEPIRAALRERGRGLVLVRTIHEALDAAESPGGDVALAWAESPGGDAPYACLAVRALTPAAVAALVAGREDEFVARTRARSPGAAYAFARKPLDLERLLGLLELVRRHRLRP